MANHPNRKHTPRYEVLASGYDTIGIMGNPGDIGAGYRPHKFIGAYETRAEAEAAAADARRPSPVIHGTNSTWQTVQNTYVRDLLANR